MADVGPRIISYRLHDAENILYEVVSDAGKTGGNEFRLYGGHRLWVSPEVERTYFPDNRAVSIQERDTGTSFTAPVEDFAPGTRLQKQLQITIDEVGTGVTINHLITNRDNSPTKLAPWSPTMLKAAGRAVLPLPPRAAMDAAHFQSVGPLTLWSFTDLADPRWFLGTEYIHLKQEAKVDFRFKEQMTGLFNPAGWGTYFCAGTVFLKTAPVIGHANYPDFGCNFEIFTNPEFLELESLGPIIELCPGETVTHEEKWYLFSGVPHGEGDSWVAAEILPLVRRVL